MKRILSLITIASALVAAAEMPRFAVSLARTPDGIIWAGTDGDGLWKSGDCGKMWQRDKAYDEVINLGEKTMSKVRFDFSDYIVRYATRSGASSQYRNKINNEEKCHKNQCERKMVLSLRMPFL